MGAFYGSVQVRSDDRVAVLGVLDSIAKRKHRFLVSPVLNGWIGIFPNHNGQDDRVGKAIAKKLAFDVIHLMVHDDDVFNYWLYRGGKLVDKYSSRPDYFEPLTKQAKARWKGKPDRITALLPPYSEPRQLEDLLAADRDQPLFASETLEQFAQLLGIPNALVAYEYLMAGETDDIDGWDDFTHVPDLTDELREKQEQLARIARDKQRYREEGKLLVEVEGPKVGSFHRLPVWCVDRGGDGFLVAWQQALPQGSQTDESFGLHRYAPPWSGPVDTGLHVGPHVHSMQLSFSGKYLATGHAAGTWRATVWDMAEMAVIAEANHPWLVPWVGFTQDERRLISLSPQEVVVTDILENRSLATCELPQQGLSGAIHPSEQWLAVGGDGGVSIVDLLEGRLVTTLPVVDSELQATGKQVIEQIKQQVASWNASDIAQQFEKSVNQAISQLKAMGVADPEKQVAEMREKMASTYASLLDGSAFEGKLTRSEHVRQVEFDATGDRLFCVTEKGVRVFAWHDLLTANDQTPAPIAAAPSEPVAMEYGSMSYTYALAHDFRRDRLLFAGLGGKVKFLDLSNGKSEVVLEIPGKPAVLSMGLSSDGSTICVHCQPGFPSTGRQDQPPLLQIWDYAKLVS